MTLILQGKYSEWNWAYPVSTRNDVSRTRQVCHMKLSVLGEYMQQNLAHLPSTQNSLLFIQVKIIVLLMKLSILGKLEEQISEVIFAAIP